MLTLYKPRRGELAFRAALLADEATMAYNRAYGGTIAFPPERWDDWAARWLDAPETARFYRYLRDAETGEDVGEAAYHLDPERGVYLCDVIVRADRRGCGYGAAGLRSLCAAAKENGVPALWDNIAADNPAVAMFLKQGFRVAERDDEVVWVMKEL